MPSNECGSETKFRELHFDNTLQGKYIDKSQHNYQTIEIGDRKIYVMHYEKSNFYDFIEIGDSLYKPNGSLKMKVVRLDFDTSFVIDFGCNEK